MKNVNYCWSFVVILFLLFTSCSKDEADVSGPEVQDTFQLQFGTLLNDFESQTRQQISEDPLECRDAEPSYVLVALTDAEGNWVADMDPTGEGATTADFIKVDIVNNGGSWETKYSEMLGLPAGTYQLQYFIVYSDDDQVLWVAPREGGTYASSVGDPLPQEIILEAGTKPYIEVDVLCFIEREEEAYGYIFFDINAIAIENNYCIFVNYCDDQTGREYPANFQVDIWGDAFDGSEVILGGEMNSVSGEGNSFAATVLCVPLPPLEDGEMYYVRVTVLSAGAYTASALDIYEFEITQAMIDAQLGATPRYEHIRINCDDDGSVPVDSDQDGIPDNEDNCPNIANPDQEDEDENGVGDVCETGVDDDGDGVPNDIDECPDTDPGVEVDEVGCESIQVPGRDMVVLNDANIFDARAMEDPDNVQFVKNLINFTTTGIRNSGTTFMFDFGRASSCVFCTGEWSTMRSLVENQGFTISDISSTSGSLTSIPSDVKIIMLVMPNVQYTVAEINTLKQFSSEGGRIIFMGEHDGFYGSGIPIENQFLINMGAILFNSGGALDCIQNGNYPELPASSNRVHPIMEGVNGLTIACASVIEPGEGDFPLFYDSTNTFVLGGVAKIDTAPISELKQVTRTKFRQSNAKLHNASSTTGY
ncbi:thrombospondin type 3 repeat-containing protein [Gillisia mitskevichiae]|uniref:Thrombospondin type 3 repeat-containing protein n=1 Tax=Gillisia mitskevichiae TaxID=270921 RepID=A0A495PKZ1_9FLAO|nr:thrombospondin type 3 repeat-containing protein [Gillisia mitskevichiae]RKS50656.1 thrombospondin type 3 repeat-containing protein [Gillisia mitskevichiae]